MASTDEHARESRYYARDSRRTARIGELRDREEAWIAGRLLDVNPAWHLADETGRVVLDVTELPGRGWLLTRLEGARRRVGLRHGSIVEVRGSLRSGRFHAMDLRLLSTALQPWPERPQRNWQRWLGDEEFRRRIRTRAQVIQAIRTFFVERDFLEVDTPSLMAVPGMEPHLDPFATLLSHPDGRLQRNWLHTSPEYGMKRLLCAGMEKIFQVCHVFRNAEVSQTHQPEFTMLEWYRAYASYDDIMRDCEELVAFVVRSVRGEASLEIGGKSVPVGDSFERLTVAQALDRYCRGHDGEASSELLQPEALRKLALERGLLRAEEGPGAKEPDTETLFFQLLLNDVEPRLGWDRPTFLMDYPTWQSALARRRGDVAERVEMYIAGVELANGFTELTDPVEQRERFEEEAEARLRLGKEAALDEEFLGALEMGMPPCSGIALGVDRLAALVAGTVDVTEVTLLPFQERFYSRDDGLRGPGPV